MSATGKFNDPLVGDQDVAGTSMALLDNGANTRRRISWAAIFGGVVLVVAVELLLSMLGAGIGLGMVNTNANSTPRQQFWRRRGRVVSSMIALAFGGYVAARLAGIELHWDGLLHGLITWCIATLLTMYLLSSAVGGIIGGGVLCVGWRYLGRRKWNQRGGSSLRCDA